MCFLSPYRAVWLPGWSQHVVDRKLLGSVVGRDLWSCLGSNMGCRGLRDLYLNISRDYRLRKSHYLTSHIEWQHRLCEGLDSNAMNLGHVRVVLKGKLLIQFRSVYFPYIRDQ